MQRAHFLKLNLKERLAAAVTLEAAMMCQNAETLLECVTIQCVAGMKGMSPILLHLTHNISKNIYV